MRKLLTFSKTFFLDAIFAMLSSVRWTSSACSDQEWPCLLPLKCYELMVEVVTTIWWNQAGVVGDRLSQAECVGEIRRSGAGAVFRRRSSTLRL